MKKIIVLIWIAIFFVPVANSQEAWYKSPQNTEISKFLTGTSSAKVIREWEIGEIKGDDKMTMYFKALELEG